LRGEKDLDLDQISEVDLAWRILKQKGEPMYFRDLIEEILRLKPVPAEQWSRAAAAIYTQLNLDPRFSYLGEGRWSLRVSQPAEKKMPRRIRFIKSLSGRKELLPGTRTRLRLLSRRETGSGVARYLELVEWRGKEEEEILEEE